MAQKQPCAKYQYVLTSRGPKILPVPDQPSKDEEAIQDYNIGGYLPVKVKDSFKDGRYLVLRKLGYVAAFTSTSRPFDSLPPHASSWGHFSTVWLVRDNMYVLSYFTLFALLQSLPPVDTSKEVSADAHTYPFGISPHFPPSSLHLIPSLRSTSARRIFSHLSPVPFPGLLP